MQLPSLITAGIESSLNQLLSLDPIAKNNLQSLNDKVIEIHFTDLDAHLYFLPTERRLMVIGGYDGEPDTTLAGSSNAFAKRQFSKDKNKAILQGDIDIKGNMQIGGQFNTVLASINIDWEEHLSHLIGDIAAHSIANTLKKSFGWLQARGERFTQDSQEYIQEEKHLVPTKYEINAFNRTVDQCRDATERLEARLKRLT
ncbi:MAG: hypothetical protein HOM11_05455 [Methylococcales bacterium]|jgi:ubiquinone biosynthesis accessory factor UbiJ|nr:hypothetical protein [Methylococcales bacterium]MBT7442543.1 hypothetical protein [Methylococcales bacterium]